ncbi:MAG TPA: hypothetical protein EYN51_02815 [Flavobacteriales bacterium]|nr:hypothetical protein [Flavobacteriales bacterium]
MPSTARDMEIMVQDAHKRVTEVVAPAGRKVAQNPGVVRKDIMEAEQAQVAVQKKIEKEKDVKRSKE